MTVTEPVQIWRDALRRLQSQRMRLAETWAISLEALRSEGTPPEQSLLEEQSVYNTQLAAVCAEVSQAGIPLDAGSALTWEGVSQSIEDYATRQQARQKLEPLLHWSHATDPHFEPLEILQDQVRAWIHHLSLPSPAPEQIRFWQLLAAGKHPCCALQRWQAAGGTLTDDEWNRLHDTAAQEFGRPLATAIGRGRILAGPAEVSLAEIARPAAVVPRISPLSVDMPVTPDRPPVQIEPRILPPSRPLLANETASGVPAELAHSNQLPAREDHEPDFVFDFTAPSHRMTGVLDAALDPAPTAGEASITAAPELKPEPRSEAVNVLSATGEDVKSDSGLLVAWSQWRAARNQGRENVPLRHTPSASLAEAALMAAGEERVRCLFRLIDQLLIDDQLDLAYQFMRVLEGEPSARLTPLPSSLIRACLLGRHVCYPQGELNRHLENDLRKQQPKRYQEFPSDGRLAYEFLCRAASLLPALLCSSTSAVRLLQAFPIEPGLIQLYNYCSRIASYAERLQGKAGEMLQTGEIGPDGSAELADLRESARDWLTQNIKQTITYSRSSPLFLHAHWTVTAGTVQQSPEIAQTWSQWQETWLTVHRLLKPVIRGTGSDRTWVKHEIERLTPALRAEGVKTAAGFPEALAEMRNVLSQAVEFATGWLRMGGGNSNVPTNLPMREMGELSAEIRERSASVLAELRPFAGIQQSPTVRAGAFCLIRVIQRIHALFESQAALAWREPELRHLLHAELLKIPCLPLNDHWEPQVEPDILETDLLDHLSRGVGSWPEAFDLQCRQGDHVATGRMLELPVWTSPAEQAELAKIRQACITDSRRELQADLDTLVAELNSPSATEGLSAADRSTLHRRIERLQSSIAKTLDFPIADIQIQQLRLMLQRRSAPVRSHEPPSLPVSTPTPAPEPFDLRTAREQHLEESALVEPVSDNAWVMDLLWEDR